MTETQTSPRQSQTATANAAASVIIQRVEELSEWKTDSPETNDWKQTASLVIKTGNG